MRSNTIQGVYIPEEFEGNGNSVPLLLQPIFGKPDRERTKKAALLHDYLYFTGMMSRRNSDHLYFQQLKEDGVRCAWLFYAGVRLFGWMKYK